MLFHFGAPALLAAAFSLAGAAGAEKADAADREKSGRRSLEGERVRVRAPAAENPAVMKAIDALGSVAHEVRPPLDAAATASAQAAQQSTCSDLDDVEWHLKLSKVPEAWEYSQSQNRPDQGEGIVIASPDTGYNYHVFTSTATATEEKFTDEMYISRGHNWQSTPGDSNNAEDPFLGTAMNPGHGSIVSAVMAGRGTEPDEDGNTVRGVAPKAKVLPLRIADSVVFFDLFKLRDAIYYARDNGAHIVSTSLGTLAVGATTWRWKRAVMDAIEANMILVTAGGQLPGLNWVPGTDANTILPASYHNVIALGAVNEDAKFWDSGFGGQDIAFAAPGEDVCIAYATEGLDASTAGDGTSMATAFTAGTAALWLAHHGRDNLISIAEGRGEHLQDLFCKAVEMTVRKPGNWNENSQGAGIVDAHALLMLDLDGVPLGQTRQCRIDITERAPNGEGCLTDEDCASGRCSRAFECDDLLAAGSYCWDHDDCQSNSCTFNLWAAWYECD